jgi:hypothetical protein
MYLSPSVGVGWHTEKGTSLATGHHTGRVFEVSGESGVIRYGHLSIVNTTNHENMSLKSDCASDLNDPCEEGACEDGSRFNMSSVEFPTGRVKQSRVRGVQASAFSKRQTTTVHNPVQILLLISVLLHRNRNSTRSTNLSPAPAALHKTLTSRRLRLRQPNPTPVQPRHATVAYPFNGELFQSTP